MVSIFQKRRQAILGAFTPHCSLVSALQTLRTTNQLPNYFHLAKTIQIVPKQNWILLLQCVLLESMYLGIVSGTYCLNELIVTVVIF